MFIRIKKSGPRQYLQIVENRWEKSGSRQHVIATLGRLDELTESGKIDSLLRGLSRYSKTLKVVEDLGEGVEGGVGGHSEGLAGRRGGGSG